jgi:hypothetical protein
VIVKPEAARMVELIASTAKVEEGSLHLSHRVDDVTAKREISAGCDRPHRRDY